MSNNWGNPHQVGMIYRLQNQAKFTRSYGPRCQLVLNVDSLVLCLQHTGDSHYKWLQVTSYMTMEGGRRFNVEVSHLEVMNGYAITAVPELKSPMSSEQMLKLMLNGVFIQKAEHPWSGNNEFHEWIREKNVDHHHHISHREKCLLWECWKERLGNV